MEILPSAPEQPSGGLQASDTSAQPLPAGYQHRMNNNSIFNQAITDQFAEDHNSLMAESSTTHDVDEENIAFSEKMQVEDYDNLGYDDFRNKRGPDLGQDGQTEASSKRLRRR